MAMTNEVINQAIRNINNLLDARDGFIGDDQEPKVTISNDLRRALTFHAGSVLGGIKPYIAVGTFNRLSKEISGFSE
jgi:hypothetical protein